ncbi:class C sortase, partial [Lacticaseibacillus paracasei]|nr:class C sortase [Lacticaseibacillus paracasei]MCT3316268.1 class C sortase [Lacticaseibacillus paracasei]NVO34101.1 class C sortase [Lacticaseibacillus paracasei subsp. paracasei]
MTKRTRRPLGLIDIVIGCLLLAGFGVLCYPFASDAYVSYQNQQVID